MLYTDVEIHEITDWFGWDIGLQSSDFLVVILLFRQLIRHEYYLYNIQMFTH